MNPRAFLRLWLAPVALVSVGCAPSAHAPAPPAIQARPIAGEWKSALGRGQTLAGRIFSTREARWVDEAALDGAVAAADFVILGETHDNADHHVLQARLVRAAVGAGRRPALAFEMLDTSQQGAVDAVRGSRGATADRIAAAVDWPKSGWPDFAMYRPIFEAGLAADLPIVAANLPRAVAKGIVHEGPSALPADVASALDRAGAPSPSTLQVLRAEMQHDHCGELPDAMLEPMVLAQRARDAEMALRLLQAGAGRGAILITGSGHARTDRGVPASLRCEAPSARVVSVALVEVDAGSTRVDQYGGHFGTSDLPFDYVVFTAATPREDPCEALQRSMKRAQP